jgi:hypothetical protein
MRTFFNVGGQRGITLWTLWTVSLERVTEPAETYA